MYKNINEKKPQILTCIYVVSFAAPRRFWYLNLGSLGWEYEEFSFHVLYPLFIRSQKEVLLERV